MSKYEDGLERRSANHVPLSPLSFIRRCAEVFPDRDAIRYAGRSRNWGTVYARCRALADALQRRGVKKNDTVAVLCPNTPAAVELSFAVPMAGAVLNMINTRLDPAAVGFILDDVQMPEKLRNVLNGIVLQDELIESFGIDASNAVGSG